MLAGTRSEASRRRMVQHLRVYGCGFRDAMVNPATPARYYILMIGQPPANDGEAELTETENQIKQTIMPKYADYRQE